MKTIAIVSKGKNTCQAIQEQLESLLDNCVRIVGFYVNGNITHDIRADLVLVTGKHVYREVLPLINRDCHVIVARRSINYHEVEHLFDLPNNTDVLLVSDMLSAAEDTILSLNALGINHINYYPCAPGIRDYPLLKIAVTPGESQLVPNCVTKVIDIKPRLIDITTLTEVLQHLNLVDEKRANLLSANYLRDIIELIKKSKYSSYLSNKMKNELQTIINTVHDGIIAVDDQEHISVFNPVAEALLGVKAKDVIGKTITQLPDLNLANNKGNEKEIFIKANNHHLVVNIAATQDEGENSGKIYTFKDVSEIQRLEEELRRKLVDQLHVARYTFEDMQGESEVIKQTIELARKMAGSNAPILVQGESGTGKELLAQGIHNASPRKKGPFIAVNFAAMTESLLESELFGYEEGSFTGARKGGSAGLFEQAHTGTIFLDEVGDAPLPFQVKLLRVLQERQVRRVGGARIIPIDVRVIAATNRDLKELIAQGLFRQDLYYRLNVLPIRIASLKERKADIPLLANHFYEAYFSRQKQLIPTDRYFGLVSTQLLSHNWPGNIRELQNVIEYLVSISPDDPPTPDMLPEELKSCGCNLNPLDHQELYRQILSTIFNFNEQQKPIGRRTLARLLSLPESVIRKALDSLENEELVQINKGRNGLQVRK